jgi:hypothetical protein
VHEVSETTALAAQVALIHHMMKALLTPPVILEVIATDSAEVACVYCGGAHLFEIVQQTLCQSTMWVILAKTTTHLVKLIILVGRTIQISHG